MKEINFDSKILKPKETCWVKIYDQNKQLKYMVITKNKLREIYFLIEINNNGRKEIAKSSNPNGFEKYYKYIYK